MTAWAPDGCGGSHQDSGLHGELYHRLEGLDRYITNKAWQPTEGMLLTKIIHFQD